MSNPIVPTIQVCFSFIPSSTASLDASDSSQRTSTKKDISATPSSSAIFLLGDDYQNAADFRSALFEQMPSAQAQKPLKPLIFLSQKTKSQFQSFAHKMETELQRQLDQGTEEDYQSSSSGQQSAWNYTQLVVKTIKQLNYVLIDEVNISQLSKAYILGHGGAGDTEIKIGSNNLSSKQLVDILQLHRISSIGDLRFTASQGVDTSVLASFSQAEVAKAEEMAKRQGATSLVHNIATEFSSRSVNSLTIFGYHGNNVKLTLFAGEAAELNQHHLRRCGKEGSVQEERRSRLRVGYRLDQEIQVNFPQAELKDETTAGSSNATDCTIF